MLGLLMMLSAAAAPAAPAAGPAATCCDLLRPARPRLAACRDTNQLITAPAFTAAVRRFIGKRKASYLHANGDVTDQQIEVLHGPPDEPTRIGALYRFTACRAHSCPEKGAAVLDPAGKIVALAILYSPCATADTRDCNRREDLVVFMRERERLQRVEVVANLRLGGGAGGGELYAAGSAEGAVQGMQVIDPAAAR